MKTISDSLKQYLLQQTVEESCDNVIPAHVAHILRELGLVLGEYQLKGRVQNQTCLVLYEGSEENDFLDSIKIRVENDRL